MMRKYESNRYIPIPPADIILDLLNDEPQKDIELLDYYDGYIHSSATEPVYSMDGTRQGVFINEDLVQEIRIEFLRSLPVLYRKLIEILLADQAATVLFSKGRNQK